MPVLQLIYAPHKIFNKTAEPVAEVNAEIRQIIDDMFATLYFQKASGIGANMVGILQRIIVVDLFENGISKPYGMVNPEIIHKSQKLQSFADASLCFPGISANIKRPKNITVNYLDYDGKLQTLEAEGFLATVIQHEIDYLDGITFLDHLSPLKRNLLLQKMQKYMKKNLANNSCSCC